MIFLRDVQPFDFCGPHWSRKNFIEAHMKHTNTTEMLINIYIYIYKVFMISMTRDNKTFSQNKGWILC